MDINFTGGEAGDPASASLVDNMKDWAVGPMAAVTSHWNIWKGFRLEGKMGASLLYTKWTTLSHAETVTGETIQTVNATGLNAVRPTFDMGLGLGFGSYFMDCKFFADLAVRYDFAVFFKQNMMRYFSSNLSGYADDNGDLVMQGLTIDLNVNF